MTTILLPVKSFERAKQRQSPLLTKSERLELAQAMLLDVTTAVAGLCGGVSIVVVTSELWAAQRAIHWGWRVLRETEQFSESQSIDWACRKLTAEGVTGVLRLPCDVPLVRTEDLEGLISVPVPNPGAVLVPSASGRGTNALLRKPPLAFASHFGPDSRRIHQKEASRLGVPLRIHENERLALDIDSPGDLQLCCRKNPATRTARYALEAGILARIEERARQHASP